MISLMAAEPRRPPILIFRRYNINLSAPKNITFWIAVVVAVVGFIANFVTIPVLSGLSFWLVIVGFVILALGNLLQGL